MSAKNPLACSHFSRLSPSLIFCSTPKSSSSSFPSITIRTGFNSPSLSQLLEPPFRIHRSRLLSQASTQLMSTSEEEIAPAVAPRRSSQIELPTASNNVTDKTALGDSARCLFWCIQKQGKLEREYGGWVIAWGAVLACSLVCKCVLLAALREVISSRGLSAGSRKVYRSGYKYLLHMREVRCCILCSLRVWSRLCGRLYPSIISFQLLFASPKGCASDIRFGLRL